MNRCLQGDQAAFDFLVNKYKEVVHAYAYHKVGDYQDAQDIAQEAFIKAYSKLGQLKWPHRFQSWLYTIISNECRMWLRSHSEERDRKTPWEDVPVEDLNELAVRAHGDEDIELTVKSAMETLPDDNQLALSLYYMSDLSVKEIANFMGISPNTVKGKLYRARRQLGERLENMLGKQLGKKKLRSGFIISVVDSIRNMPIPSVPNPPRMRWAPIPVSIGIALLIGIIGYGVSSGKDVSPDMPILKPATFEVSLLPRPTGDEILEMELKSISDLASADVGITAQTQPAMGKASSEMVVRRVWENALSGGMASVSPDGRYISYANWDMGNLAIHDLETGENRDVTDEGNWGDDMQYTDVSIWSPDSKQIAYAWLGTKGTNSLRIAGIDGAKPRVLYSNPPESGFLSPRDWSQDGKHILALHYKGKAHEIVLVSVADGSMRVLKSLEKHNGQKMSFTAAGGLRASLSPDGRYVVYDFWQSRDLPTKGDILLLATDGSHETTLVKHPANDGAPFWSPDGNRIVFSSDRSGDMGLWVLEVVDGKPKGFPQLISHSLNGMYPLGVTQDGSYYYELIPRDDDVYVATLDPETGEVVTPPVKAIQSFEGFNYAPSFSPDGNRLAYASRRPRGGDNNFRAIVIRSLETGEERELSPKLTQLGRFPQWSPDGRSILTHAVGTGAAGKKRNGLHQIDTETDAATPVVWNDERGGIVPVIPPVWSPDGKRIFFVRKSGDIWGIKAYDLETKREWSPDFRSKLGKGYKKHNLALSPDGQQLAFIGCIEDGHSFQIAPSGGGETREILRVPRPGGMWLMWTPDGRHLLFARHKDEATELWRVPVEGGEAQNLGLTMKKIDSLSFHPDGRRIAFTGPGSGRGTEVCALENILPKSTASR